MASASHIDRWSIAGYHHPLRSSRLIRVCRQVSIRNFPLTGCSNAEAGLALICTCLPAFVGQFRQLESRIRYGSARSRNAEINEITSDGDKSEFPRAFVRGTSKARCQSNAAQSPDEVELVAHAQGTSTQEGDIQQHNGILRQVEVTHKISYTTESSDTYSKAESQ